MTVLTMLNHHALPPQCERSLATPRLPAWHKDDLARLQFSRGELVDPQDLVNREAHVTTLLAVLGRQSPERITAPDDDLK